MQPSASAASHAAAQCHSATGECHVREPLALFCASYCRDKGRRQSRGSQGPRFRRVHLAGGGLAGGSIHRLPCPAGGVQGTASPAAQRLTGCHMRKGAQVSRNTGCNSKQPHRLWRERARLFAGLHRRRGRVAACSSRQRRGGSSTGPRHCLALDGRGQLRPGAGRHACRRRALGRSAAAAADQRGAGFVG